MEPFLGQIILLSFDFDPPGWLPCDGREMPVSGNDELFSLLGTRYGGDGRNSFGLPKLSSPDGGKSRYLIATRGVFPSRS